MKATQILVGEHVLILRLLDLMKDAADRIIRDEGPPREFFEKALDIARQFADKFHHYKEEHVMFGLLAQKHDGQLDGEIERHRNQHEQCRDLIQRISDALASYSRDLEQGARVVHRHVSEYVATLRSHIRSENEIFFPMAEDALSEEESENLLTEFSRYEAKCEADAEGYGKAIDEAAALLES